MIYMLIYCIFFIGIAAITYSLLFPDFEYYIQNGDSFIYSLAWEDPRLDFKYLNVENDNVLMITTGGCNVLNTLLESPKKIVSVDISKNQNALLDLKLSAIKNLDFETFWMLFGEGKIINFDKIYNEILRKDLTLKTSKIFWDKNLNIFKNGIYNSGGVSYIISYLNFMNGKNNIKEITNFSDVNEQYKFYKNNIEKNIFNKWTRFLIKFPIFSTFAGVPVNQVKTVCNGNNLDVIFDMVKDSYDNAIKKFSIKDDNYFAYGLINGKLSKNNCPEYLKKENFENLKKNIHKINIKTSYISDYLYKTNIKFDKFILLDHLDWMNYDRVKEELTLINANSNNLEGIFRSGNKKPWYLQIFKKMFEVKDLTFESINDRLGTYPGFYKFKSINN